MGVQIYQINFTVIRRKFMACFFIIPIEKQVINFPKIVQSA